MASCGVFSRARPGSPGRTADRPTLDWRALRARLAGTGARSAAWRAVWGALRHNKVLLAKHARWTSRDQNRLAGGQARTACAATLLRWLWAVITTRTMWDARIAAGQVTPRARRRRRPGGRMR
jgi:hypothetical protein